LVDEILAKYPNDVKVVIKNFPLSFHKQAYKAAQYSLAAHKQGKYKEIYHKIMENFRQLKTNEDLPLEYAREFGLDMNQFIRDFESPEVKAQLDLEMKQMRESGMPRLAVPKFLVQGKEPSGRDIGTFSAMIDAELKK
jgi:predicted DsbA family dithiol-disulfide isomerase